MDSPVIRRFRVFEGNRTPTFGFTNRRAETTTLRTPSAGPAFAEPAGAQSRNATCRIAAACDSVFISTRCQSDSMIVA